MEDESDDESSIITCSNCDDSIDSTCISHECVDVNDTGDVSILYYDHSQFKHCVRKANTNVCMKFIVEIFNLLVLSGMEKSNIIPEPTENHKTIQMIVDNTTSKELKFLRILSDCCSYKMSFSDIISSFDYNGILSSIRKRFNLKEYQGTELKFELVHNGLLVSPIKKARHDWEKAIDMQLTKQNNDSSEDQEWLDAQLTSDEDLEW